MPAVLPLAFQFYGPLTSFSAEATLGQSATGNEIPYPGWLFTPSQDCAFRDTSRGTGGPGLAVGPSTVWLTSQGPGASTADCRTCFSLLW